METILALDIGTSSTRAIIYNADTGEAVPSATATLPHEPKATPDGGATLDAGILVHEAVACAGRALAKGSVNGGVAAVAVSTFWHSTVGIGPDGRALTPLLLWSDRRSAPQVARLRAEMDPAAYTERTGCPLHTSYLPGRLSWLAETDPQTFRACTRFVSPGEYLFGQLLGAERVTCSFSMASASGLMDQAQGAWDTPTLRHLHGLTPDHLNPLGDDPVSGLLSPHRGALPALADAPWFPALGDGACSNLGCGATEPGRLALMIGTSGALRAMMGATRPPVPAGLWRYQADPSRYLLGGALSNGGNVWAWLADTLRLPDLPAPQLEAALAALAPDSHGLTVLPFLNGERAPAWQDDARAVIVGLGMATTPLDIARAHLEAVAYRFAAVRDRLQAGGEACIRGADTEIVGTGAALRASPVWAQILADVLNTAIAVSAEEQASSRGAALWARERLGRGKVEGVRFPVQMRHEPDAERAARYREGRSRHEALYSSGAAIP